MLRNVGLTVLAALGLGAAVLGFSGVVAPVGLLSAPTAQANDDDWDDHDDRDDHDDWRDDDDWEHRRFRDDDNIDVRDCQCDNCDCWGDGDDRECWCESCDCDEWE